MTKPIEYRCQFCGEHSAATDWKALKDHCPKCGCMYDWLLAQEGDD